MHLEISLSCNMLIPNCRIANKKHFQIHQLKFYNNTSQINKYFEQRRASLSLSNRFLCRQLALVVVDISNHYVRRFKRISCLKSPLISFRKLPLLSMHRLEKVRVLAWFDSAQVWSVNWQSSSNKNLFTFNIYTYLLLLLLLPLSVC